MEEEEEEDSIFMTCQYLTQRPILIYLSLSGARLTGSASTDFKMVEDRRIRGEPQDAKVDLIVKIDDFTVKVIQN